MNNAAIIVFKKSSLPKALKFFAVPRMNQTIEAGTAEDKVAVYIISCPVMKDPIDNRRIGRMLKNMCRENNISFLTGRDNGCCLESGLEDIEGGIERSTIDEARAIKDMGVLIKLSVEKDVNLLKKNMCFIGDSNSYQYISTMSEEASGVFIYEHDKMDSATKKAIFERLMSEKGISAVFTKDLDRAVLMSEIILADNSVELESRRKLLSGKILIGSNPVSGNFQKFSQVSLWYDDMEQMTGGNVFFTFNDELLCILRHFYKEKNTIDFIRRFPYIYFSRFQGSDLA